MKQRLLLTAILFVACSISVAAQESRWSLKPNGGITVATLSGDEVEYLKDGWGWTLGVEAERRLSERLGLSLGIHFTKNLVNDDRRVISSDRFYYIEFYDLSMKSECLTLPLMVNFHITKGLTAKFGVQPTLLLAARERYKYLGYQWRVAPLVVPETPPSEDEINRFGEYRWDKGVRKQCQRLGTMIPVGLSYEWRNIQLDVRYHFALYNLLKDDKVKHIPWSEMLNSLTGKSVKSRYLQLTVGYRFNL